MRNYEPGMTLASIIDEADVSRWCVCVYVDACADVLTGWHTPFNDGQEKKTTRVHIIQLSNKIKIIMNQ